MNMDSNLDQIERGLQEFVAERENVVRQISRSLLSDEEECRAEKLSGATKSELSTLIAGFVLLFSLFRKKN